METPGRRLILDLLAKSVAKINAACSETSDAKVAVETESKKQLGVNKRKNICNGKETNIKKIKVEIKNVIKQDPVEVKIDVKKEYIEAEVDYISDIKLCVEIDRSQAVEIKQEYVETDMDIENKKDIKAIDAEAKYKSLENYEKEASTSNKKKEKIPNLKGDPKSLKIKNIKLKVESCKDDTNPDDDEFFCIKKDSFYNTKFKVEHGESKHDNTEPKLSKDKNSTSKRNRKSCVTPNRFTPAEDEIIFHAIKTFGDRISASKLARKMNRLRESVRARIEMLKAGKKASRRFSLVEDQVIMDAVMKQLPGEGLAKLDLPRFGDWKDFSTWQGLLTST